MKDIAAFIKCNREAGIRIFIDVTSFGKILKHLKKYKTHKVEFYETILLLLDNIQITEKYYEPATFQNFEGYYLMVLSRGKVQVCILCKQTYEERVKNIILIELFTGLPENVESVILENIIERGGYDYDFKG